MGHEWWANIKKIKEFANLSQKRGGLLLICPRFLGVIFMQYTDDYFIGEINAGGSRQEIAIKHLYEQFFSMTSYGRQKYAPPLDDDDLVTAYNSAVISLREQIVTGAFRGDSSISTYLNRIFTNKCIDLLRAKNAHPTEPIEKAQEKKDETPGPLKSLIQNDQIERVFRYLKDLGDTCKQILLDSEYWGYSSEEIAKRIGFGNAASVNSKKYTCLQRLRELLGGKREEEE